MRVACGVCVCVWRVCLYVACVAYVYVCGVCVYACGCVQFRCVAMSITVQTQTNLISFHLFLSISLLVLQVNVSLNVIHQCNTTCAYIAVESCHHSAMSNKRINK